MDAGPDQEHLGRVQPEEVLEAAAGDSDHGGEKGRERLINRGE